MQTHTKDAAATVVTFLTLVGTVHAGIWFSIFGVPDVTVLNWPFHYFWFAFGAWMSILAIYGGYHRAIDSITAEKQQLAAEHADSGVDDGASADGGDG